MSTNKEEEDDLVVFLVTNQLSTSLRGDDDEQGRRGRTRHLPGDEPAVDVFGWLSMRINEEEEDDEQDEEEDDDKDDGRELEEDAS